MRYYEISDKTELKEESLSSKLNMITKKIILKHYF